MTFEEAIHLLLNHASLARDLPDERCLSVMLLWLRVGKGDTGIDAARHEVIECLKVVNRELNGDIPSSVVSADKAGSLPRELVYAVSALIDDAACEIQRMSHSGKDADVEWTMKKLLTSLSIAWNAVLAGDIDDLDEHIRLEQMALGFDD